MVVSLRQCLGVVSENEARIKKESMEVPGRVYLSA